MKILTALELSQLNKEQLKRCQTTTWELDSHEGPVERCESVGIEDLKIRKGAKEWHLSWNTPDDSPVISVAPNDLLDQADGSDDMLHTVKLLSVLEVEAHEREEAERIKAAEERWEAWDKKDEERRAALRAKRKATRDAKKKKAGT